MRLQSFSVTVLGALCVSTFTSLASAQLGKAKDVVIGAERLFGIYGVVRDYDSPRDDLDDTSIGFLMQGYHLSPVTVPRAAFDVFIIESLSLGGSLGVFSNKGSSGFLFSPRVGYAIAFNQQWAFWPKGGFTYYSQNGADLRHFSLSLEPAFTFMPTPSVGFTAAPIIDLGLSGEYDVALGHVDFVDRAFGVGLGMFARF
jgi:hypothetical protein